MGIVENGRIAGYNVLVGGGLGMTHGKTTTFPRVADDIGFCLPDQAVRVAEKVVKIQRDFGNRSDRRNARLNIRSRAVAWDWFKKELHPIGMNLEESREFSFDSLRTVTDGPKTRMENGLMDFL